MGSPYYNECDCDQSAPMLWETIDKIYKFIKEKKDPEYMAMFDDAMGKGYATWDIEE